MLKIQFPDTYSDLLIQIIWGRDPGIWLLICSLVIFRLPMQETQETQALSQEDPLEEEMATPSNTCLRNSKDRGAWQATVHVVVKSQTWPSDRARMHWWFQCQQTSAWCWESLALLWTSSSLNLWAFKLLKSLLNSMDSGSLNQATPNYSFLLLTTAPTRISLVFPSITGRSMSFVSFQNMSCLLQPM